MWPKIKMFWTKYETKIILVLAFLLVSSLSFEAGLLKGTGIKESPIIVEKIAQNSCEGIRPVENTASGSNLAQDAKVDQISNNTASENQNKNCAFVGSKNSNKYHLPTCRWSKNIKLENVVCFSSEDDAKSRGYLPDKNCIK